MAGRRGVSKTPPDAGGFGIDEPFGVRWSIWLINATCLISAVIVLAASSNDERGALSQAAVTDQPGVSSVRNRIAVGFPTGRANRNRDDVRIKDVSNSQSKKLIDVSSSSGALPVPSDLQPAAVNSRTVPAGSRLASADPRPKPADSQSRSTDRRLASLSLETASVDIARTGGGAPLVNQEAAPADSPTTPSVRVIPGSDGTSSDDESGQSFDETATDTDDESGQGLDEIATDTDEQSHAALEDSEEPGEDEIPLVLNGDPPPPPPSSAPPSNE